MAMKKKATPAPKPTIAGLKKMNLDKTAGKVKGLKKMSLDKTAAKASPTAMPRVAKPKPTPTLTWEQKQRKAEADLLKKRRAEARRTGSWPNGYTN